MLDKILLSLGAIFTGGMGTLFLFNSIGIVETLFGVLCLAFALLSVQVIKEA